MLLIVQCDVIVGEGTPLRERDTTDRRRKDDLRVIVIGLTVFVGGVAIALFVQLIAGTKQVRYRSPNCDSFKG